MHKPRLLLADEHQLLLDGLRKLLEPEFELAGTVSNGRAAVDAYERLHPDLLLLDIALPLVSGVEAAREVKKAHPTARILFVTAQTAPIYIEEAFRAGASGYVLKQSAAGELVNAIWTVLRGASYISPSISSGAGRRDGRGPGVQLTPRQDEVLQLVAEGKSMKEIAGVLGISVRTVEFHKNGLMDELGLRTTAELTRYALDRHSSAGPGTHDN